MMWSVPERQPELAGEDWRATGITRLESRLWGLGLCGGGCIDPRGLSGTRHYYTMPNGKVKRPANFFPIFFGGAAGRPVGRSALAFGGGRQRKAPDIGRLSQGRRQRGRDCAEFVGD